MKYHTWNGATLLFLILSIPVYSTSVTSAPVEPPGPDTPASRMAASFLEAFAAGDVLEMGRFLEENRSIAALEKASATERAEDLGRVLQQVGALAVVEVRTVGDYTAEVIVRSEKLGMWFALVFELESEPPHRLAVFDMKPTAEPGRAGDYDPSMSLSELAERARRDAEAPALAVSVVVDGRVAEVAVVGTRRADDPDPARQGDRFQIGSVTKAVTATLIGRLVEEGKLRWDRTLGETFPEMSMHPEYRDVRLEHLLQHLGGIRPYTDDEVDNFPDYSQAGRTPEEAQQLFAARVLEQDPVAPVGAAMRYSNAGYSVAAHMAEVVTGKSYRELVAVLVLQPLALDTAGFGWPASRDRPGQPRGHFGTPPNLRMRAFGENERQTYLDPSGGMYCSIEDLGRFAALHLAGLRGENGLLRAETIRRLHTPLLATEHGTGYASGWILETDPDGGPVHWHSGSGGAFHATLSLYPDRDLAVAVVTNSTGNAGVVQKMLTRAIVKRHAKPVVPAAINSAR